ncbi:MAG: M20/M25/M40 family metallo-hydrolase [Solirubrobacterales bacterium]|nr:M20/M25/M40 family metallo-hydrolase [Solirubrobacterales bacterium]
METLATELLQQLLRFNTVNPPGDERVAQEWLAGVLEEAGFEVDLLGATPERPNLVARLRGAAPGPVLCLLSHMDTVLATPSEWQRGPWSGDVVDGVVWGRGAQDMKSQTASEVAAALTLAREGWRPVKGDLLVVCVVDEETGGANGAKWICREHPDKVRCDYLLNEGGGTVFEVGADRHYGVCIAEKGVFRFTLTAHGRAGHASMPAMADNALPKLAPLLATLATAKAELDVTDAPKGLLEGLGIEVGEDAATALEELRSRAPELAAFVEPMLSVTFAPTMIGAGAKINVIPSQAWLKVDCRVPPGMDEDGARARIEEVLAGHDGYELSFDEEVVGNGSKPEGPLWDAIAAWLASEDPDAKVLPSMLPAFTDSRTFRAAFPECTAYGFYPQREMSLYEMWPLVHGKDERIHASTLGFAARAYKAITEELLG